MNAITSTKQVSSKDAYVRFWLRWRDYRGRSSRQEYWKLVFVNLIIFIVIVDLVSFEVGSWISGVFELVCLVPMVTLTMRRLHDSGHSSKWAIPVFGGYTVLLILGLLHPTFHTTNSAVAHSSSPGLAILSFVAFLVLAASGLVTFIFVVQRSSPDNAWGPEPQ